MGAIGRLLAYLSSTSFGLLFGFLARYLSVKQLIIAASIAAFIAMVGSLTILFNTLLSQLSLVLPADFAWGLGIIPENIPVCVSAVITARVSIWAVNLKMALVHIKLS